MFSSASVGQALTNETMTYGKEKECFRRCKSPKNLGVTLIARSAYKIVFLIRITYKATSRFVLKYGLVSQNLFFEVSTVNLLS